MVEEGGIVSKELVEVEETKVAKNEWKKEEGRPVFRPEVERQE